MDAATQDWILGIAGVIIMILLGGNGYWIKRLVTSIDQLRQTVIDLQLTTGSQETEFVECKKRCEASNTTVNERLKDYSKDIKRHGRLIATINAKLNIPEYDQG